MNLKLSWHMVGQLVASLLQILNLISGQIPQKYQVFVAAVIAGLQMLMGYIAHQSTPDGQSIKELQTNALQNSSIVVNVDNPGVPWTPKSK